MIITLALRNLFHDQIRLAVTLVGILFSIVLMAVELGMFLGSTDHITAMIERSKSDLWITAFAARSFEEGGVLLTMRERHQALVTPGVKKVIPLVVAFAEWRKPAGGSTRVVLVGTNAEDGALEPWSLVQGDWQDIKAPDGISADDTYFRELGIGGLGATAQIATGRVKVKALTHHIRSFTQSPFVFTTLTRARNLLGVDSDRASFYLVQLEPGAQAEQVRQALFQRLDGAEVLTKSEFRDRSLRQWLFHTGAGFALLGGAILGFIVGTVIVVQTLYASTKDHLHEFVTLRALGASSGYLYAVILVQAIISAIMGFALGISISLMILYLARNTPLPLLMTPGLAVTLFALTVVMSAISAVSAIIKVTQIDPASAFTR
jgi:putative ABC transport system permease protein